MKSGTITLTDTIFGMDEIKADVQQDLLVLIIVEAIRNILWQRKDQMMVGYHEALTLRPLEQQDNTVTADDVYVMSLNHLMDVIELNDPLFDNEDVDSVAEVSAALSDKLSMLMGSIDRFNHHEVLLPYQELLFNFYEENEFPSVSGTFVGNKVVLCFTTPTTFGMATI